MKSTAYILGFFCGLLAVLVVCIIARIIFKKKFGFTSNEYDERQKAIQGAGYKYAYLTLLVLVVLGGLVEMMLESSFLPLFPFAMACMWLSLCVFITYCILKDAYFSLRSRRKTWTIIFLSAGIINLTIGVGNLLSGYENYPLVNLLTGISLIYLALVSIAKALWERRTEVEE